MSALIVYESMFGNTRRIAEAIMRALEEDGVDVTITHAAEAPTDVSHFELVVIGSPTHAHTLPLPASRAQAAVWAEDTEKGPAPRAWGARNWGARVAGARDTPGLGSALRLILYES